MLSLLAVAVAMFPGSAWAATVESVRVAGDRIVVKFDGPVTDAASTIVAGTRQILLDISNATPGRGGVAAGPVTRVTQSRTGVGARVVFDLSEPTVIGDAQFERGGRELTLQIQAASPATFAAAAQAGTSNYFPFNLGGLRRPKYKISVPVPAATKATPLPRVDGNDRRPLVVIDAGHGGVDPGAISPHTGLKEKDATLKIARAIRDELLASGRVRVALTRDNDRYILHRERFGIARRLKADLFISIHCDSAGTETATGATAYTLSEVASDKEAARLAARENKADVISGVNLDQHADVSSILIDLAQRETINASAGFARLLGREARPLMPVKDNFHRMASLMVLKAPDTPSVLFETGYISNRQDAEFLASDGGRERIAQSVTRAVEVHFAKRLAAR
ncbi:N-acetylmuramoyl-L-alanine amidase [Sphingomonas bacterium]|uniref:N-acetylmuramoyl-L-alanine amidase family protein n=1 Tax=Sphingomonas bacterium TaxID=1895847 RepID=UPI002639E451|nr:N-acetylmuramoyl-L-alanine amidase [Sphingomonas bacterium]